MRHGLARDTKVIRTARAAIIMGFDQLVIELGGDPAAVLQAAGVELTDLVDSETPISAQLATTVLNLSALETRCDHFGLELAKRRNLDTYLGVLGRTWRTAPTLGDAFTEAFDLFGIHSEASLWQLQTSGSISYILFSLLEESGHSNKQAQQLAILLLWRFVNVLSGYRWHPTAVSFSFSRPSDDLPYRRVFDAHLEFDSDFCGVVFHASDLELKLPEYDMDLHEQLRREARTIKEARTRDFAEEVRILMRKNLEMQKVGEESVTCFYPFQRRTLQRKLADLGTSYRELLKEVRTVMAMELLTDSDVSITRISDRLCYQGLPNFTKAFKKQTGVTPREWRKQTRPTVVR